MTEAVRVVVKGENAFSGTFNAAGDGIKTLADRTDEAATKASIATGAFGALDSGMQLLGQSSSPVAQAMQNAMLATDALSGVMDFATLAATSFSLAKIKETAATVMASVAQKAAAAATVVMTGAQWLLNAALTANPIGLVVVAIGALVAGLVYAYTHSETFRNIVNALFLSFMEGAKIVWNWLMPAFTAIGKWIQDAVGWFANLGDIGKSNQEKIADAASKSAEEQKAAADAVKAKQEALVEAYNKVTEAIFKNARAVLGLRADHRAYLESIDTATEALKKNGRTLDENTKAGRDNAKALDSLASTSLDYLEGLVEQGKSQRQVTSATRDAREEFVAMGERMGLTRAQAKRYADQLGLIPGKIHTTVTAAGLTSALTGSALLRQRLLAIDGMRAEASVVLGVANKINGGGTGKGYAHGGVVGAAASGGVRSGMTWVGENGPELLDAAPGSTVHSAADSASMAARSGGSSTSTPMLTIGSDDTELGDFLLRLLSRAVRQRGGNVQVAVMGRS